MSKSVSDDITQLPVEWGNGNEFAPEQLFPLVYEELRKMARRYMRREALGHTFQTTELIHEAYLKAGRSGWKKLAESLAFLWCRRQSHAAYSG